VSSARIAHDEDLGETSVEAAGRFRLYLGAAAGVGKTFAMLDEGQRRAARGTDVVIGFVECHGRPKTEARMEGLEILPRKAIDYRGTTLYEMDLDAILERNPKVCLIDELAHTNVPGSSRHEKRWEDVLEVLDAGIDVISTVNIQHLESVADAVEQITETPVRERVPDWVVRKADQIELVDSSPEQLRRRMLHGNIYPADKVPQALSHFFRADNLVALRELALRFLADETEEDLLAHLQRRHPERLWETTERIMVGVTAAPGTDGLMRRAARFAGRLRSPLDVVHISPSDDTAHDDKTIAKLHVLADDLGARWHEIVASDPARALIAFAHEHQITQIIIGSSQRSRLAEIVGGGSIARKVQKLAGASGIDVHTIARRERADPGAAAAEEPPGSWPFSV
jgi:two-component system, OmpR family, sensor histidine kinase KdpD